jgi:hypothetical protein
MGQLQQWGDAMRAAHGYYWPARPKKDRATRCPGMAKRMPRGGRAGHLRRHPLPALPDRRPELHARLRRLGEAAQQRARLRAWQDTGMWGRLHRLVLDELSDAAVLD